MYQQLIFKQLVLEKEKSTKESLMSVLSDDDHQDQLLQWKPKLAPKPQEETSICLFLNKTDSAED